MVTVLMDGKEAQQVAATVADDGLWLSKRDLAAAADWEVKPEGICQGDLCVIIPRGKESAWVRGDTVNLAALWRHLDRPVLHDDARAAWVFGAGAEERTQRLGNLEAADFELPDLAGKRHRLSAHRGKRVFLVTWASW
jgi:hypothetical protein